MVPHEGEQHGCVLTDRLQPRFHVHRGGTGEKLRHIDALKRGRQGADGTHDARATTDPVPHGKTGEPALRNRVFVQFAPDARDGDGVLGEVEPGLRIGCGGFEHAIAGFLGPARLGNDQGDRGGEFAADFGDDLVHAVRVRVVEE